MDYWKEDQLNRFYNLKSEKALFDAFLEAGRELGFDYCAYGLRAPIPVSQPRVKMLNNYSSAWNEHYASNNYLDIDPSVRYGLHSGMPMLWSEKFFDQARALWHDAQSAGLRHGWAQAARDGNGAAGLITLARTNDALTVSELRANQLKFSWLSQVFHHSMSKCLFKELVPELSVRLTPREVEALKWAAAGKTSSETGYILGISDYTVGYHLNNAMVKLDCTNKVATTVKALSLGLIT